MVCGRFTRVVPGNLELVQYTSGQFYGPVALWIIVYGIVQSISPIITNQKKTRSPNGNTALLWVLLLSSIPGLIAWQLLISSTNHEIILVAGLMLFGIIFAINSSIHSFLILAYSRKDGVSLDVGFYYMANAMGRLIGTVLSGIVFQWQGLEACLIISSLFLIITAYLSQKLDR